MEQPEIEFLATDKFQITQTGSRILTGLQVTWKGAIGTYHSGKKNSEILGEAFQAGAGGALYIDVSDDSLSFTGNSNDLGAFTMGMYFWGPAWNYVALWLMVQHQEVFAGDLLFETTKWRLAMFLWQTSAHQGSLTYSTEAGAYDFTTFLFDVPAELRTGWIHLAYTYDPNQAGGTLRSYVNGKQVLARTSLAMRVYGTQGAYAIILPSYLF